LLAGVRVGETNSVVSKALPGKGESKASTDYKP
jgi:hypothetical protein